MICNAILKTLLYQCKNLQKLRVLSLGPTEISAANISGTTINSGIGIKAGLTDKSKAALINTLSEVKFLIIGEPSAVSSDLWTDIDSRLGEIFMIIPEKVFAGVSVVTVSFMLQLSRLRGKLLFSQFSDKDSAKDLLGLQLRFLLKYAELTEVVRQKDKFFMDLLNKVRVGNIYDDAEKLLKARFIHESDQKYPKDALHIYAENEPSMKRNGAVLNDLLGEFYIIEADEKIPNNCKYPLAAIQAAQNQNQTNTGGLPKFLKLKCGAKVMLTVNLNIQNRLINCQTGNTSHIEFSKGSVRKVFVKYYNEQAGFKAKRSPYQRRKSSWVPIEKFKAKILTKKDPHLHPLSTLNFLNISLGIYSS